MLEISPLVWGVTIGVIIALLAVDLILAALRPHKVGFREATAWSVFYILVAIGFGVMTLFDRLPGSFLPDEDQGVMLVMIETPEGSTTAQTQALVEKVEEYLRVQEAETVESTFSVLGFSFGGSGQNQAMLFAKLREYDERPDLDAASLVTRANGYFFMNNRAGQAYFLQPPAIPGMGASSGFSMYLVDQSGRGQEALTAAADQLLATAQEDGRVTNLRGNEAPFETSLDRKSVV